MAYIQNPSNGKRTTMRPVDLTPMVDLGFILITFFVFTSAMSQATAMKLILPNDSVNDSTRIKESNAFTVIPVNSDDMFYYRGKLTNAGQLKACSMQQFRVLLLQAQQARQGKLTVMIKPYENCSLGNLVNVLDEMTISVIKSYALTDINDVEAACIKQHLAGHE